MELHTLGQYVLLIMIIVFCSLIILFIRAYLIYKQFYKLSENNEKLSSQKKLLILHKIRGFCYNTPYMPDINIAATTALQAIEENGREKALEIGANVVMPNITPTSNRTLYKLYENKPGTHEGAAESMRKLEESILKSGSEVAYGAWGDSRHFQIKANNTSSSPFQPLA